MRVFLSLFAAVLALISFGCSSDAVSQGIDIDKSFRHVIWPGATLLAGVNVAALQNTELYRRHAQQLDLPLLNEAKERFGFDPRRDLKLLLLESDGRQSLLLAGGSLQVSEIKQHLASSGAHWTTYRSFPLLGNERESLALLNTSLAIGGSGQAVRSALDLSGNKGGSISSDLQSRLEAISKGSQMWIVSSKGLPFAGTPMRSDIQSALSNIVAYISGTTAALQIDSGLRLKATLNCSSPAGSQRVHDALRGGIGLARLSTRDDQSELLKVYDAIQVNQVGSNVEVSATLNSDEVEKLMTSLPGLASQISGQAGRFLQ